MYTLIKHNLTGSIFLCRVVLPTVVIMSDHDYNLIALHEACDEDLIEEIEVDQAKTMSKEDKVKDNHAKQDMVNAVLRAVQELTPKNG